MTTNETVLKIVNFAQLCGVTGETALDVARRAVWLDEQGRATEAGRDLAAALLAQRGTISIFVGCA
jgi:hypothetical protein